MTAAHGLEAGAALEVLEQGERLSYTFRDLMNYHGSRYPGGVAHAFKVMERALPLLDPDGPPERREVRVQTPFTGPGARDAFEMVTRAVTDQRYLVDPALARVERGPTLERYVFRIGYRSRQVTLVIRAGFVTDEFITLSRKDGRTSEEDRQLKVLKTEMADRLLASPAEQVYDVQDGR